jgi:hypothetical protein
MSSNLHYDTQPASRTQYSKDDNDMAQLEMEQQQSSSMESWYDEFVP